MIHGVNGVVMLYFCLYSDLRPKETRLALQGATVTVQHCVVFNAIAQQTQNKRVAPNPRGLQFMQSFILYRELYI